MRRWVVMSAVGLMIAAGCSGRRPSILLERHARGPISEAPTVATGVVRKLEPVMQTLTKGEVEVVVNHASAEFLTNFFDNKKIFGPYAGLNPYYPEHLVFYVKIANRSDKRIRIDPREFVLVDDLGSQYSLVGTDYVTAFAEYRAPVATTTRGLLSEASPGYFGVSFPVGRMFAAKPQNRFALLQQSALQLGYLYPGVLHDGLIAFWNPAANAKQLRLFITNVKTDFDANDWSRTSLEFSFEFAVTSK